MSANALFSESGRFRLAIGDVTGAIGDSVTVLPLVVALGILTPASLPHLLFGFGIFQVIWGAVYGVPLSVEPMKALAGLAIAGGITYGELVAAGLLAGGILYVAGESGTLTALGNAVGAPVIRGVQFAVACLLGVAAVDLAVGAPGVAAAGVGIALAVAVVSRRAVALVLLAVGGIWAVGTTGVSQPALPAIALFPTGGPTVTFGAAEGLLAQLAMTVGNAAIATSLLLSDLYETEVSPDQLGKSMGLMNLAGVPLGAIPMCHGSGGLAGKHAFGARTGAANLVAGGFYAGVALLAGTLFAFPMALLGVLLAVVAVSLARVAFASTERPVFVGAVGAVAVLTNVGVAFVAGTVWWYVRGSAADG